MALYKQTTARKTQRRALARLRENIADIEGRHVRLEAPSLMGEKMIKSVLPTGCGALDDLMGGGLILPALTEIYAETARDGGALTGFMAALLSLSTMDDAWNTKPVLWICAAGVCRETGMLYGRGLQALGFDPSRLFLITPKQLEDALWICEEAARTKGLGATVLDMRGPSPKLNLPETRRLHIRAQASGRPVFLLRQSATPQTSAAPQRLIVKATTSADASVFSGTHLTRRLPGSIGPPGFEINLEKNKSGPAGSNHILHWNSDERTFYTRSERRAYLTQSDKTRSAAYGLKARPESPSRETDAYFVA